jgi:transposase
MAPTISGSAGTPSTITEPEEAFLMGEADFLKFVQRCNEESLKAHDRPARQHAGVDRCRPHRHAEGLRWPGRDGADALATTRSAGHVFVFRGRRGDILKVLWFDGQGLMLLAKRLERGRFVWPQATEGAVSLTPAQLSMLLEGIDWRMPCARTAPDAAAAADAA